VSAAEFCASLLWAHPRAAENSVLKLLKLVKVRASSLFQFLDETTTEAGW